MPNMMDYLTWRGDLSLAASPWNQVDGLILASFSYNDLGEHARGEEEITLRELASLLDLRERRLNTCGRGAGCMPHILCRPARDCPLTVFYRRRLKRSLREREKAVNFF